MQNAAVSQRLTRNSCDHDMLTLFALVAPYKVIGYMMNNC